MRSPEVFACGRRSPSGEVRLAQTLHSIETKNEQRIGNKRENESCLRSAATESQRDLASDTRALRAGGNDVWDTSQSTIGLVLLSNSYDFRRFIECLDTDIWFVRVSSGVLLVLGPSVARPKFTTRLACSLNDEIHRRFV